MGHFTPKIYIKDQSYDPIFKAVNKEFYFKSRFLPGILLALGFLILATQVVIPLIYFKTQTQITKPIESSVLGLATGFGEFEFAELSSPQPTAVERIETPAYFYLSIPKLGIEDALVETNSPSLQPDYSLGHYKGSGLPGEPGNAFIYGHSVLPWFFNAKNYKTIFSTLDKLEAGDEILIEYKETQYRYKVEYLEAIATNKVDPLAQYKPKYLNESTVTLMTCWPMGTKSKRLLVRAVLN